MRGRYSMIGLDPDLDERRIAAYFSLEDPEPARTFFRYTSGGWTLADATDCADCAYFDVHSSPGPAPVSR